MKNLIEYRYSSEVNFYNYIKNGNLENLIVGLRRIEKLAFDANNTIDGGSLWFKFNSDDTLCNTIDDIERDLSLPKYHNNYIFLIEKIKDAIDLNGELFTYFS